jgi:uncharacterized protein YjbJ (UPF0337 family)
MSGLVDRITGRVKKAAGDLKDDPKLREQGTREEQKADAKEALARAQREADERAEEVARLERESARGSGTSAPHHPGATPGDTPRAGNP